MNTMRTYKFKFINTIGKIETIIEDIQDNTSVEMRCCEEVEWRGSVEKGRDGDGRVRVRILKENWI